MSDMVKDDLTVGESSEIVFMTQCFDRYDSNKSMMFFKSLIIKNLDSELKDSYMTESIKDVEFEKKAGQTQIMIAKLRALKAQFPYFYKWLCYDSHTAVRINILRAKAFDTIEDIMETGRASERLKAAEMVLKYDTDSNLTKHVTSSLHGFRIPDRLLKMTEEQLCLEYDKVASDIPTIQEQKQ